MGMWEERKAASETVLRGYMGWANSLALCSGAQIARLIKRVTRLTCCQCSRALRDATAICSSTGTSTGGILRASSADTCAT